MKISKEIFFLFLVTNLFPITKAYAINAGDLDVTFGVDGVFLCENNCGTYFYNLAIDSQNRILLSGRSQLVSNRVLRLDTDGVIDSSFGDDGFLSIGMSRTEHFPLILDENDNIFTIGYQYNTNTGDDYIIAKVNSDGILDSTFGTQGLSTVDLNSSYYDIPDGIVRDASGRIIVVGQNSASLLSDIASGNYGGFDRDAAVIRLNQNGELDTSFANGVGVAVVDFGMRNDIFIDVKLDSQGRIIVLGQFFYTYQSAIVRFTTDGVLDSSFGTGGIVLTDPYYYANSLVVDSQDNILIAGKRNLNGDSSILLMKYNTTGILDTTFGESQTGIVTTIIDSDANEINDEVKDMIIDSANNIVVVAQHHAEDESDPFDYSDFAVLRYNANGQLDSQFGTDGIAITDSGTSQNDEAMALEQDLNGNYVAAGYTQNSQNYNTDLMAVRFLSNLSTDTDDDGTIDSEDAFPNDATEAVDTDVDGVGDQADDFPNDPNQTNATNTGDASSGSQASGTDTASASAGGCSLIYTN